MGAMDMEHVKLMVNASVILAIPEQNATFVRLATQGILHVFRQAKSVALTKNAGVGFSVAKTSHHPASTVIMP